MTDHCFGGKENPDSVEMKEQVVYSVYGWLVFIYIYITYFVWASLKRQFLGFHISYIDYTL